MGARSWVFAPLLDINSRPFLLVQPMKKHLWCIYRGGSFQPSLCLPATTWSSFLTRDFFFTVLHSAKENNVVRAPSTSDRLLTLFKLTGPSIWAGRERCSYRNESKWPPRWRRYDGFLFSLLMWLVFMAHLQPHLLHPTKLDHSDTMILIVRPS